MGTWVLINGTWYNLLLAAAISCPLNDLLFCVSTVSIVCAIKVPVPSGRRVF